MVIKLDPQKEEQLEAIAKASGRSVSQVVEDAIERVIREEPPNASTSQIDAEKRAAMLAEIKAIQEIASDEIPDDGFSGRDHDKVIYRRDW